VSRRSVVASPSTQAPSAPIIRVVKIGSPGTQALRHSSTFGCHHSGREDRLSAGQARKHSGTQAPSTPIILVLKIASRVTRHASTRTLKQLPLPSFGS
jgi:hypothetical protein